MPIYEYKCQKCGNKFEIRRSFADSDADLQCPKCGAMRPNRVFSTFCVNQSNEACVSTSST